MSEDPKHRSKEIRDFCQTVCRGEVAALQFCDLWFDYCHRIDDLIDTREDGRPTMTPEEILTIFGAGLMLYNCEFYLKHQRTLFPIILAVTNCYMDVVQWEKSPVEHQRKMADVLRCCANELFFVVAMITGGWSHMRDVSARIRERSWLLQHDESGQPN